MKKLIKFSILFLVIASLTGISFSFSTIQHKDDGFVKVYLKNDCSHDVKVYITNSGGGTLFTVDDKTSKPESLQPGQKIYDENQRTLIAEITASSEGKTIVVCD